MMIDDVIVNQILSPGKTMFFKAMFIEGLQFAQYAHTSTLHINNDIVQKSDSFRIVF